MPLFFSGSIRGMALKRPDWKSGTVVVLEHDSRILRGNALRDPHVRDRALVADYPDEEMGHFPQHAITARLSGTPGAIRAQAPRLGEHTRDVLREAGLGAAEIDTVITSGLARTTP